MRFKCFLIFLLRGYFELSFLRCDVLSLLMEKEEEVLREVTHWNSLLLTFQKANLVFALDWYSGRYQLHCGRYYVIGHRLDSSLTECWNYS